jgi:hypothetical protein
MRRGFRVCNSQFPVQRKQRIVAQDHDFSQFGTLHSMNRGHGGYTKRQPVANTSTAPKMAAAL